MSPQTLARVRAWSEGGKGRITFAPAALGPGWSVTARRHVLHGFGDNEGSRGSASVGTDIEATADVEDPSDAGLDLAINLALDACERALSRWPVRPVAPAPAPPAAPSSARRTASAIVVMIAHRAASHRYGYRIQGGPDDGVTFVAHPDDDNPHRLLGALVTVSYHPDDQFARRS